jgi:hypothetical protein
MVDHLTQLPGVPSADDARPGMAFYAGTGPAGKTCGDCTWRGYERLSEKKKVNRRTGREEQRAFRSGGCEQYRRLSGGQHGPAVRLYWAACRYFSEVAR